jgi:double-stranded uracil-DNA glycosylase
MTARWPTGPYDILAKDLVVVFCGLNPSVEAATIGRNFGSPTNRFWRALHLAGFTSHQIAPDDGLSLLNFGCGITAAVGRGTPSADEVGRAEFRDAAAAFERKIAHYRPLTIAFLGKSAYGMMAGLRDLDWGEQTGTFGGSRVWLLPNPSGLNRAFTLTTLVDRYNRLRADVAGELQRFASRVRGPDR